MFNKVLIANRGEIAVRIIRACREMGIRTVAVYSQADADSMAVRIADEAVCIGPAKAAQSYLCIDRILSVAAICDVDDIHPRNKRPVGERAAEAAMHNWENDQVYQPPMPQICIAVKNNFIVTFDREIAGDGEICTLMLAGSDGVYHPASGVIVNGRELHITSGAVAIPVSARYAWSNHPAAANLTDVSGNLISPFEIEISAKKPTERKIDYEQSGKSL